MADDEIKVKKERDPIMMVCFVVFLLAVCAVSGATVYNNYLKADDTIAVSGSTVSVNYVGTYYDFSGKENAAVFDTSYWGVANDDKVLKSNDFTLNSESSYKPLSFTVGGTSVITGFSNAVIGHKVGDRFQVKIEVGDGYTAPDTERTVNASSVVSMPTVETLTAAQFKEMYGYDLRGYSEIEKSVYGWPASATYNAFNNTITMSYRPVTGTSYTAVDNDFGTVSLRVTSPPGSTISFTFVISGYTVISASGADKSVQMMLVDLGPNENKTVGGVSMPAKFYVTSVTDAGNDGIADTFKYKTVDERYNQVLYFEIELVSIG
ncbi:MAG: FKBP-type peptidyl-prolyl cis-trans isomerase [Candidatus Methanoplasma sp.]|jgi:hypothetical protein|nr:FKBP-type peptidyl-prolyl cis-trans isomerase [Candidatus Methanoplasma sp.]